MVFPEIAETKDAPSFPEDKMLYNNVQESQKNTTKPLKPPPHPQISQQQQPKIGSSDRAGELI